MNKVLAIMTVIGFTTGCMTPMHPVPIRVETAPKAMVYANDRLLGSPSDDMPIESTGFPEADIWFGADYSTWVNEDTGVGYLYVRLEGTDDETIVARCGDKTSASSTVERAPHWPAVIDGLSKVLAFVPLVGMLMPVAWDVPYQEVKLDIDDG